MNKNEYALHYRNPQLYISLGMKLASLHRALKFKDLNLNIDQKNAANSFEKDFFRLMNNSTFGKTM